MNDLISRQAAIDRINGLYRDTTKDESYMITGYNHAVSDMRVTIKSLPSATQEQPAEWVPSTKYRGFLTCSACEDCYIEGWSDKERKWRYCPQCGKRMSERGCNSP